MDNHKKEQPNGDPNEWWRKRRRPPSEATSTSSAFTPYSSSPLFSANATSSAAFIHRPRPSLVARLTQNIVSTFQTCNPEFKYSEALNPKRFLTSPAVGTQNDGQDNENSDLILYVNLELVNPPSGRRYVVKEMLGQGTFGQVAKCWDADIGDYVAIKVIKNLPAYFHQAIMEVSLLHALNQKYDPDDQHHIVRMLDHFQYQNHLCISFEMLDSNLYELLKRNNLRGLSLKYVQRFSKQILEALVVMKDAGIIHCDLKPENILIAPKVSAAEVKVIDFGSACLERHTVYSYIQSRYYRSPEVLLGYPYTTAIDMWSLGCIVAELYLGVPLFPGSSEYDVLVRMMEILGVQPPDTLLRDAKLTSKFFKHVGSVHYDGLATKNGRSAYRILTEEEFEAKERKKATIGRWYFPRLMLDDLILTYPWKKLPEEEILTDAEKSIRMALVDFLKGLVEFDPHKRWSPLQASGHPFVTGAAFVGPYKPIPETPRIPVSRTIAVDRHNPGGGHWLAAGLSPQVADASRYVPINNSPHYSKIPYSYGSSYGSLGSHGSYNDNPGLAGSYGSYGSYGEVNTMNLYCSPLGPSGFSNLHSQVGGSFLGSSPDVRRRPHLSHGGYRLSPGSLGTMSLGVSPSQFTPPSSQMQIPGASPGKYGPTSPARGIHGSSLGKAAVVGQYNKRRGHPPVIPSHEYGSHHGHGFYGDAISSSHPEAYIRGHAGYPQSTLSNASYNIWRPQVGSGSGFSSDGSPSHGAFQAHYQHDLGPSHLSDGFPDPPEFGPSVPDPADWDPNYSDESLLQEDNSEVRSLVSDFGSSLHLGHVDGSSRPGRAGHVQNNWNSNINPALSNQRVDHLFQPSSRSDMNQSTSYDAHKGIGRSNFVQQFPPNRHVQQQLSQRTNHININYRPTENSHQIGGQNAWPNYIATESHSSPNAAFGDGFPWGVRPPHSFSSTTVPPHARKDYGRIF